METFKRQLNHIPASITALLILVIQGVLTGCGLKLNALIDEQSSSNLTTGG
jgi:hypothetical protein